MSVDLLHDRIETDSSRRICDSHNPYFRSRRLAALSPLTLSIKSDYPFKNRSRASIITDILEFCRNPILRTHIMNKANLSYATLKNYVNLLVSQGLLAPSVDEKTSARYYATTQRGLLFLEQSRILRDLLAESRGSELEQPETTADL
jgi:predicted transcriptional regulator